MPFFLMARFTTFAKNEPALKRMVIAFAQILILKLYSSYILSKVLASLITSVACTLLRSLDTRVQMINQLLRDSDATSMAHSLELRVPFARLTMVDLSRSCHDHHKLLSDAATGDEVVLSGS